MKKSFLDKLFLAGLKKQIFLGFAILVLFFGVSAIFNIYTIRNSQITLNKLFENKEPSVEVLNEYKLLMVRSKMLTTNWVYMQKDEVSKAELKHLQRVEYPLLKTQILHYSQKWTDQLQKKLILEVLKEYELMQLDQVEIMKLLPDFKSYNDPFLKFQAEDLIESKIGPTTTAILHKLDLVIENKNKEKNAARENMSLSYNTLTVSLIVLGMLLTVLGFFISVFTASKITAPINNIKEIISALSKGEQPQNIVIDRNDEIGEMSNSVNILVESLRRTTSFAEIIGTGNFEASYTPLSDKDLLGYSLVNMRDQLRLNTIEENKRSWINSGLVKLNDILINKNVNNTIWHNDILTFVVTYLGGIQGGLFLLNDNIEEEVYLDLVASYAYDENRIASKRINPGVGVIGQVFSNREPLILREMQGHKVEISYMNAISPKQLVIYPLMVHSECFGVLEISFIKALEPYQENFITKLVELISSTISFVHNNNKTTRLLYLATEQRQQLMLQDEELRQSMEELVSTQEQTVKAKEKAEAAVIAKTQFLSVMSHEIRTPMNAVIGMTNLLMESNPKPDQLEIINILKFSAGNLLGLINDILDFSKIDAGKVTLEKIDFDLLSLINNVKSSISPKANEKHIVLNLVFDNELNQAYVGDPVRLAQILTNLLNNAVKFTNQGAVTVSASLYHRDTERSYIDFEISDTGIGIPDDKLEVIFENFSQASSDTTRLYGGTGLGLAITKKLLKLMDSDIFVESELGKGSKFYFRIQLEHSAKRIEDVRRELLEHVNPDSLSFVKLLLVEDNETNVMVASRFLQKWNVSFDVAQNGVEALEYFEKNTYDIILMDLQMPIMDGYEATKKIRLVNKVIPVIALTAEAMLDIKDYALEIGMNDYVTKPFNPSDLYNKILKYANISNQYMIENKEVLPIDNKQESNLSTMVSFYKYYELADNDNEFLMQLLQQTLLDYQNACERYPELVKMRDIDNLGRLTHKIKPTMTLFGLNDLDLLITSHKTLLKDGASDEVLQPISAVILKNLETVVSEIEAKLTEIKNQQV